MARALLIMNPAAARTTPAAIQTAEAVLRRRGWQTEVVATGGAGDARRLAEYGIEQGVDVVGFSGGRDHDAGRVGAGGNRRSAGPDPGGTGNILAGNLRLPRSPIRAAEIIANGHARKLDLGRVERPDGVRCLRSRPGRGWMPGSWRRPTQPESGVGGLGRTGDPGPGAARDSQRRMRDYGGRQAVQRRGGGGAGLELRRGDSAVLPAPQRHLAGRRPARRDGGPRQFRLGECPSVCRSAAAPRGAVRQVGLAGLCTRRGDPS